MALKIRLRQQGRTNRPFYRVVVTDCCSPRDGRYLEDLGWYNPGETEADKNLLIRADRVQHWLNLGAQLTEKTESLVAKAAPSILREQTEKKLALRAKNAAKRKQRKKGAE
ncbi:30S ribosomal protein S16 [Parachlamydia sp. AcF125]|uniref:30S ribosomal protein S16 n=1 Tax=Parachlamydia sp. AcF125 TaxID=2795736 RepID=UPI001BC9ECA2|nr:30S ribosomal protein S16 [Parachlamydia sp. AcF125]MBS4168778.1 30S ribosomal protein S16 [Parachlamydia sp. AcF125]